MDFSFSLLLSLISISSATLSFASPFQNHPLSHLTPKQSAQNGGGVTEELWCVAKNNAEDAALQSALDWACGSGGADCGPIQQGGPCYDPADIQRTASYAFNDYFLKHGLTEDGCNFSNAAALTSLNPSYGNCKFSSSSTGKNRNFNGSSFVGIGPAIADTSDGNCIMGCLLPWAFIIPLVLWV